MPARRLALTALTLLVLAASVAADEGPISGALKAVDPAAGTLTLESTAGGRTRQVVVHVKPGTRIVKFVRPSQPGAPGFVEQPVALADLRPGWILSVRARHEGQREVADAVTVVLER